MKYRFWLFVLILVSVTLGWKIWKPSEDGKITLRLGEVVTLDGVRFELTQMEIPDNECRDCLTTVSVKIWNDNEKGELNFKMGGFAGLIPQEQEFGTWVINVDDVDDDIVILKYDKSRD